MSDHSINNPKHWLDRAQEARTLAKQIRDPEGKRTMVKNADDYERLAQQANEQQAAGHNQNSPFCPSEAPRYLPTPLSVYPHGDPDNVIAFTMVRCCASCDKSSGAVEGLQPQPLEA